MPLSLLNPVPIRQLDNNGAPVAGALLHTWRAGTTTNLATFTDSSGAFMLPDPVIADSEGFFPAVWMLEDTYDLEARKPDDVTVLWQSLDVTAKPDQPNTKSQTIAATSGQKVFKLTNSYTPGTGSVHVFANGLLVSDYLETDAQTITFPKAQRKGRELTFVTGALVNNTFSADASLINYTPSGSAGISQSLATLLGLDVPIVDSYGAIGDGNSHPLSSVFPTLTLAQIQVKYPNALALTDEIDGTVLQYFYSLGIAFRARSTSAVYLTSYGLDAKHGSRFRGIGNWAPTANVGKDVSNTRIKYVGPSGPNTYVLKYADQAMGTDPSAFPSTRDMSGASCMDVTLDGNGLAAFGLVRVRCGSGSDFRNITVTGTQRNTYWDVQCFGQGLKSCHGYINQGAGHNFGENIYGWANSTTDDQASPQDCLSQFNGCDSTGAPLNLFNETTGVKLGYGMGFFGNRAFTPINCQSQNNDGVNFYLATTLAPLTFIGGYGENGTMSSQIKKVDNFTGTGAQTAFVLSNAFGNAFYAVTVGGAAKVFGTDYTVAWSATGPTSTLTFTTAPANGAAIVVNYNRQWCFWNASTLTSWAIRAMNMRFGIAPSHRITGVAPSRIDQGMLFDNCPVMGEVLADFSGWGMHNCDSQVVITGSAPARPLVSNGGFQSESGGVSFRYREGLVLTTDPAPLSFGGATTNGTGWAYTASQSSMSWDRLGRRVNFGGKLQLTALGNPTGNITIIGLPFTVQAGAAYGSPVGFSDVLSLATAVVSITGYGVPGTKTIQLFKRTAASTSETPLVLADLSATTTLVFGGSYPTSDA